MPNPLQQAAGNFIRWAMAGIELDGFEREFVARRDQLTELGNYYAGYHNPPLKLTKVGKDYNVLPNLVGLIVDRSVSMLVGAGVQFDLPGQDDTEQSELIDAIWNANHKDALLHDLAEFGGTYGTSYAKIIPEAIQTRDGGLVARLVALNPSQMTVGTDPHDIAKVLWYQVRYNVGDEAWREITELNEGGNSWSVRVEKTQKGKWTLVEKRTWEYPFPPIVHGKNLPRAGSQYGTADIERVIQLQDTYNESISNVNKILSGFAWPQRYVKGGRLPRINISGKEVIDVEPGKIIEFSNPDTEIKTVEMESDLGSSRSFCNDIRRDMFDIARTTDTETIKDKVGALTNFGLRVLYKDELAKNHTKQLLYGQFLSEINERLLLLAGYIGEASDPGLVVWGDPLPVNEQEEVTSLQADVNLGIVSKQTVAAARGYDWEVEQERLAEEKTAQNETNTNVGGQIIRNFLAGRQA